MIQFRYPITMRVEPTVTSYNPLAANAQPRDVTSALDFSAFALAAPSNENNLTFNTTGNAATADGNNVNVQLSAEAEL
jgi:hypothetical protein